MSAEQLIYDAQYGEHEHMRAVLVHKANTCEADDMGLTPLMHAVWNGHVECVKYLVSNDVGVDVDGVKRSSLYMKSVKGYTALHLAAYDCVESRTKEITTILLVAGLDTEDMCNYGKTSKELAMEEDKPEFLAALKEFEERDQVGNEKIKKKLDTLKETLLDKYAYIHNPTMNVEKWNATFTVPSHIYEEQRVGEIPEGMYIHEHQIKPLIEEGYSLMSGVEALNCIEFAKDQANINEDRREKLLQADSKSDWEPVDIDKLLEDRKKKPKRGAKRKDAAESESAKSIDDKEKINKKNSHDSR